MSNVFLKFILKILKFIGQGRMTDIKSCDLIPFWKSLKETQAGPWEWDQVNILQDTCTWESALKGMLKIRKETLEDLTFSKQTHISSVLKVNRH